MLNYLEGINVCGTLYNIRMLGFAFKPEKTHTCTYAKFSSEKVISKKVQIF